MSDWVVVRQFQKNDDIMRWSVSVLCAALSVFLFVACSSNPGIKAGKSFLHNPAIENFKNYTAEVVNLDDEEKAELEEWTAENKTELELAVMSMVKAPEL